MVAVALAFALAEVASLVIAGTRLGIGWTFLGLVCSFVIGMALMSGRGAGTMRAAMAAVTQRESPAPALIDGIVIAIAAILFMSPGFASDGMGLVLLVPPVRRWIRERFLARARERIEARMVVQAREDVPVDVIDVDGVEIRRESSVVSRLPGV